MDDPAPDFRACWEGWKADLDRVARRDRWGRAFLVVGWVHLGLCLVGQAIYRGPGTDKGLYAAIIFGDALLGLAILRVMVGWGVHRESPLAALLLRVWGTFLLISLNLTTLNGLTGYSVDWFKLGWCAISSFGFAMTAWLLGLRYLVFAFQMYFTGLAMAAWPDHQYLIYGVSWWAALQVLGGALERHRLRASRAEPEAIGAGR